VGRHVPVPGAGVRQVKGRRGLSADGQEQGVGGAPGRVVRESQGLWVKDRRGAPPDMTEEEEEEGEEEEESA